MGSSSVSSSRWPYLSSSPNLFHNADSVSRSDPHHRARCRWHNDRLSSPLRWSKTRPQHRHNTRTNNNIEPKMVTNMATRQIPCSPPDAATLPGATLCCNLHKVPVSGLIRLLSRQIHESRLGGQAPERARKKMAPHPLNPHALGNREKPQAIPYTESPCNHESHGTGCWTRV